MFTYPELIKHICSHAGKTEDEIHKLVKEKQEELSGLVSEEGAAHIIARELGLELLQEGLRTLKIKNLTDGMRSVDITGKVMRIFEPRHWEKNDKKGMVANLLLGDETGVVRMVLWNEEVDLLTNGTIKEDDVIRLRGGYVRKGMNGQPEISKGQGRIDTVDEDIQAKPLDAQPTDGQAVEKPLSAVAEGDTIAARVCLVQLYNRNPFYEVCPSCGKRMKDEPCPDHGKVQPAHNLVISGVVDDGQGNMRAVFFREQAEILIGMTTADAQKCIEGKEPLTLYEHIKTIGREFRLTGRVRRNSFTEDIELVANAVHPVDVKQEIEQLMKTLPKKS